MCSWSRSAACAASWAALAACAFANADVRVPDAAAGKWPTLTAKPILFFAFFQAGWPFCSAASTLPTPSLLPGLSLTKTTSESSSPSHAAAFDLDALLFTVRRPFVTGLSSTTATSPSTPPPPPRGRLLPAAVAAAAAADVGCAGSRSLTSAPVYIGGSSTPGRLVAIKAMTMRVFPNPMASASSPPRRGAGRLSSGTLKFVRLLQYTSLVTCLPFSFPMRVCRSQNGGS
mmetsp:Transcript_8957/g.27179  ORF Transcript_8957/g.27179 Transcript_8957/m.27179 type:complete len:230 (-) Transcript_8957:876-1565(-)